MKAWVIEKNKTSNLQENKKIFLPSEALNFHDNVPIPEILENEALIKIRSAGLNFNTVWSAKAYPVDSFQLVMGHVRRNPKDKKHIQDYFIPGSDGSGTVVKIGKNNKFKEGDEVVVHCAVIADEDMLMKDPMLSKTQSVWGYETNFGSFAEYSVVKISQLIPKPKNLAWNISGSYMLTLGTAYRMLASKNGLDLKKNDTCLIWGASGGLGVFAIQICNYLGVEPVCVVSTKEKADFCRKFGAKNIVITSEMENSSFLLNDGSFNLKSWSEMSLKISNLIGTNKVDSVFEHPGADTLALSVYLLKRGGKVVTCAATSGFKASIDLRYLWMEMKQLIGSHFCNSEEANLASALIQGGHIIHAPSQIINFKNLPGGLDLISQRKSVGKIAVDYDLS